MSRRIGVPSQHFIQIFFATKAGRFGQLEGREAFGVVPLRKTTHVTCYVS